MEIHGGARVIDVGDDVYDLDAFHTVNSGYKNRYLFEKTFTINGLDMGIQEIERLLLKYLPLKINRKIQFTGARGENEKKQLLKILYARLKALEESKHFKSNILIHTLLQRYYKNILQLIYEIEHPTHDVAEVDGQCPAEIEYIEELSVIKDNKKKVKKVNQERLFKIILGMAWYLLNPGEIPENMECQWAKMVQHFEGLSINDVLNDMKKMDDSALDTNPLNYFKKVSLSDLKNTSIVNMGKKVKGMLRDSVSKSAADDASSTDMKQHINRLLTLLAMKKYLKSSDKINANNVAKVEKQLSENPMAGSNAADASAVSAAEQKPGKISGGGYKIFDTALYNAMTPFFDYFKVLYDPIYSFLEGGLVENKGIKNVKNVILPELLQLLHVTSKIKSTNRAGVYKLTGITSTLLAFINRQFAVMQTEVQSKDLDKQKVFIDQLNLLPDVRLSSIMKPDGGTPFSTAQPVYLQFLTKENIKLPTLNEFSSNVSNKNETHKELTEFFAEDSIFVLCTKDRGLVECVDTCYSDLKDVPMTVFEIEFNDVDITKELIINPLKEHYFNTNEFKLDKLLTLHLESQYTADELALSIFILFKELMPKESISK